jgi:hypothetical protein
LITNNGRLINGNADFNRLANAIGNVMSVKASA